MCAVPILKARPTAPGFVQSKLSAIMGGDAVYICSYKYFVKILRDAWREELVDHAGVRSPADARDVCLRPFIW